MKKIIALALALVSLFAFAACGAKTIDFTNLDKDLSNVTATVDGEEGKALGLTMQVDKDMALDVFGLTADDVEEIFYISPAIVNVDCVLIVKPAKGKADAVQAGIDKYVQAALDLASWYIPENADRINARLETEWGGYKILIISYNNEGVLAEIKAHA